MVEALVVFCDFLLDAHDLLSTRTLLWSVVPVLATRVLSSSTVPRSLLLKPFEVLFDLVLPKG